MGAQAALDEWRPPARAHTVFHEGELAVQRRAGVDRVAAKVGQNILRFVPPEYDEFLSGQPFVVVASRDAMGRVWASPVVGGVGSARALDDRRVLFTGLPTPGDPLEDALARSEARIGVLAIQFDSRLRIRLNGLARRTADGILLTVEEAFGNCPKFIQRRRPTEPLARGGAAGYCASEMLGPGQAARVERSDSCQFAGSWSNPHGSTRPSMDRRTQEVAATSRTSHRTIDALGFESLLGVCSGDIYFDQHCVH